MKNNEKKLIGDSLVPMHIVNQFKDDEQLAKLALRLPKWLQRRLCSVEAIPVKGYWPGPYHVIFFAFNICHTHIIEFGQMDRWFDIDTLRAFIHNYNRFEKILTDYPHPISISYNPNDDASVVTRDYDLCRENEKAEYITCAEEEIVVNYIKNSIDEAKFKIKPTRDYVLIQSHLNAGNDIGIEVYWKYNDPLEWFDEFLKQLDRLFVIKEWNIHNLCPRIPITIRPKQI